MTDGPNEPPPSPDDWAPKPWLVLPCSPESPCEFAVLPVDAAVTEGLLTLGLFTSVVRESMPQVRGIVAGFPGRFGDWPDPEIHDSFVGYDSLFTCDGLFDRDFDEFQERPTKSVTVTAGPDGLEFRAEMRGGSAVATVGWCNLVQNGFRDQLPPVSAAAWRLAERSRTAAGGLSHNSELTEELKRCGWPKVVADGFTWMEGDDLQALYSMVVPRPPGETDSDPMTEPREASRYWTRLSLA